MVNKHVFEILEKFIVLDSKCKMLELGAGDGSDFNFLCNKTGFICSGDFKAPTNINLSDKCVFVEGNFISDQVYEKIRDSAEHGLFDVLYSAYSLCFNKKEKIETYLKKYFSLLKEDGIFCVADFTDHEEVVTNRTNLFDDWFTNLVLSNFKNLYLTKIDMFEKEHNHSHHTFVLVASNKKLI